MAVELKRDVLIKHLERASKCIARNNTLPALRLTWIIVEWNCVTVKSSDMEYSYVGIIRTEQESSWFNISIDGNATLKILKLIEDDTVFLTPLGIKVGKKNFPYKEIGKRELNLPEVVEGQYWISSDRMEYAFSLVKKLVKTKSFSPVLTAVNIQTNGNTIKVFWTDSFIMRLVNITWLVRGGDNLNINIPVELLNRADLSWLDYMEINDNLITIYCKDNDNDYCRYTSILVNWNFPDYQKIIDNCKSNGMIEMNTKELNKCIALCSAYWDHIAFKCHQNEVVVTTDETVWLEIDTEMRHISSNPSITLWFTINFLKLQAEICDSFSISYNDEASPLLFDTGDTDIITICRPLLLNNTI